MTQADALLGCGPYFEPSGLVMSIAIFVAIKPLAYFAFIQSFRYRVARAIPMRRGQAAKLAALRAVLGFVLIGGGAWALANIGIRGESWPAWVYLYVARVGAWWVVGKYGASLRGRRLVGWIVFGTLLNTAFDVAVVAGLLGGWLWSTGFVLVIAGFIVLLHKLGERASLKAQFTAEPHCRVCEYNLTGNLSGICPECGTIIVAPSAA